MLTRSVAVCGLYDPGSRSAWAPHQSLAVAVKGIGFQQRPKVEIKCNSSQNEMGLGLRSFCLNSCLNGVRLVRYKHVATSQGALAIQSNPRKVSSLFPQLHKCPSACGLPYSSDVQQLPISWDALCDSKNMLVNLAQEKRVHIHVRDVKTDCSSV